MVDCTPMPGKNGQSSVALKPHDPAPALGRGLALLALMEKEGPSTLQHLAQLSGLAKSTTLRLLGSLCLAGLVKRESRSLRYIVLSRLVPCAATHEPIRQALREMMIELAQQARQTVELHAYQPAGLPLPLTMIDRCEPKGVVVRVQARIGFQRKLSELDALTLISFAFGERPRRPLSHFHWDAGRKNRLSQVQVEQQMTQARQTRVAVDLGVNNHGVRRYAAPLLSRDNRLLAVLAIAQYVTPLECHPLPRLAQLVRRRAILMSQAGHAVSALKAD